MGSSAPGFPPRQVFKRVPCQRFGAEAEDVAIRIFDVKLERLGEIGERHADGAAAPLTLR